MIRAVTNGKIVLEDRIIHGTVIIDSEGKIADILTGNTGGLNFPPEETADAEGRIVVPGGVDGHVHFGGFGDIPIADDFYTGSKAALAGGTTTVVDFCEPMPGEDPLACISRRKQHGEISMVDFTFHYTFTKNYQNELPLIGHIKGQGISAFKAFTYYDNTALKPGDFREIMSALKDQGTLLIHGEEKTIIDIEKAKVQGKEQENMLRLSLTRPNVSELIAVETVLALAKESGVSICIAHTSAAGTADIRKRERLAGNDKFILETCPHYLYLTRDKLRGSQGALFTMNPPLRGGEDNERLWQAVLEGDISILSTDHCPYLTQYKMGKTFLTVPCGVDGVQTRMLFLFSEGVKKRNLPLEEFVKITSTNAALFYKLYPQKGVIRKGSDADLVIIDPGAEWIWDASSIAGATDYSVLDGLRLTGKISQVIKGGNTAVKDDIVAAQKGSGKFIDAGGR
jgi:dihydropyrimidinase